MSKDIVEVLKGIVGEKAVLTGDQRVDRSAVWGTDQPCVARAVVCPANTAEVAAVLKACNEQGQSVATPEVTSVPTADLGAARVKLMQYIQPETGDVDIRFINRYD